MPELKQTTKRALIWSAIDTGGQQVVSLLIVMVTMKLLSPETFGLFGTLAIFTSIANTLSEGGLSIALIRKTDATEQDNNTMFWFNLALSLFFYLLFFAAAPWIARYNNAPELTHIARVQFLYIIIYSAGLIQSTQLIKRAQFKRLALANTIPVVLGGAAAIAVAWAGYGVWALVAQHLTLALSRTLLFWTLSGWRPRWSFSVQSFRGLFRFSSKILLGTLVNNISANFYSSTLGRFIPLTQLGFYNQANKIRNTGVSVLTYTFGNPIYLMLSKLQHDPERYKHALRKAMRTISFLVFPALLGLIVVSRPLMETLFGQTWLASVPFIRILCLGGIFSVLNYMHSNALKIKGRSDLTLTMDIVGAGLLVVFLFVTIGYGLKVAVISDAVSRAIVFISYSVLDARVNHYSWREQLRDLAPYLGLGIGMAALIWPLQCVIVQPWLLLTAQVVAGGGFYLGMTKILGSKVMDDVLETLKIKR